jgi:hypothetical protein
VITAGRCSAARALASTSLALVLATACAAPRPPTARPIAADDLRVTAAVAALVREGDARRGVRGVARVAIDGPGGSGRAKQILVVERPERLRVEVLGLLDQTIALLVTDGRAYRIVRSEDRSVERGAVHDALLAEVTGVALSPADAVRMLLAAPLAPGARVIGGATLSDGGVRAIVARESALERESLDFDAEGRLRSWARLAADGEPLLEARWSEWRDVAGDAFPHALAIVDHPSRAEARVEWTRVELDPELAPALFELPPP